MAWFITGNAWVQVVLTCRIAGIAVALTTALVPRLSPAQSSPGALNDTGIIVCYGPSAPCDPALHFKQDAMVGRDAAARSAGSGLTTNTGKGFSFTKISRSGAVMADSAVLGENPTDWACTRDNLTGLVWEVKTTSPTHVRYVQNTYTWFNPDPSRNGGFAGVENGGSCSNAGRCDTDKYIQDLRSTGICGQTNWRLPLPKEMLNIYDLGNPVLWQPFVMSFFPNAPTHNGSGTNTSVERWTPLSDAANSMQAWFVDTSAGALGRNTKYFAYGVMAVAGP